MLINSLYVASGRVGLWKDIFTVSMNDKFDAVYRQKMGKSDLTFDFGLWTNHMANRTQPIRPTCSARHCTLENGPSYTFHLFALPSLPSRFHLQPDLAYVLKKRKKNCSLVEDLNQHMYHSEGKFDPESIRKDIFCLELHHVCLQCVCVIQCISNA